MVFSRPKWQSEFTPMQDAGTGLFGGTAENPELLRVVDLRIGARSVTEAGDFVESGSASLRGGGLIWYDGQ